MSAFASRPPAGFRNPAHLQLRGARRHTEAARVRLLDALAAILALSAALDAVEAAPAAIPRLRA